jgi:protein arginine N-methyltransferase 5
MGSWFPIFFPLMLPITLPANSTLKVDFFRCISSRKVWYEWTVTEPIAMPMMNPNGRSYWIGL